MMIAWALTPYVESASVAVVAAIAGAYFKSAHFEGLISGIFSKDKSLQSIGGEWFGHVAEIRAGDKGSTLTPASRIILKVTRIKGGVVSLKGSCEVNEPTRRKSALNGFYNRDVNITVLAYEDLEEHAKSVGSILLKGDPRAEDLIGYWTGLDSHLNEIMVGPVVLTRSPRSEATRRQYAAWLAMPCKWEPVDTKMPRPQ